MALKTDSFNINEMDNISLTAYRIIAIFNLLMKGPCSDKDINECLQNDNNSARALSQDTICIYINTLRAIGCLISRPSKKNEFKYVLKSHPFKLNLSDEEINCLMDIKKYISTIEDWKLLIKIDNLLDTIENNLTVENKKVIQDFKKSNQRYIQANHYIQMISTLENYCNNKRTLVINYVSPESGEKLIEFSPEKLSYDNGSIYLWGYNIEINETQYLRIDRIKDIKIVKISKNKYVPEIINVKYKLKGASCLTYNPEDNEEIISKENLEITISAQITNKFKFVQKMLSFGADCIVISPENIRTEVITKIKSMLNLYGDE